MILLALALLGTLPEADDPRYPLGRLRLPPVAEPARPARLVDLRYGVTDAGATTTRMEARVRLGASIFAGAELATDRLGAFLDTQRLELGFTESNAGDPTVEASYRAPWFLVGFHGERTGSDWTLETNGAIRVNTDFEVLLDYREDFDERRSVGPSLEEFIETGVVPEPGPPIRELRSGAAGFLYQRDNHLELLGRVERARLRSAAGFDFDEDRARIEAIWNPPAVELDAELEHARTGGRLDRSVSSAEVGARIPLGSHLLARAATLQVWERGLLRFQDEYRAGLTWFGRRFRFARRSDIADEVLELQRRANELGYNERRVYDLEALRAFRERLGISPARSELRDAVDALYRAQVRERNVPQLGFEIRLADNALTGVDSRTYRGFVGIPWPVALPFTRGEARVDFLQVELLAREDRFPAGIRSLTHELSVVAFLNREIGLRLSWTSFGRTPEEVVRERSRPSRLFVGFDYALGR